MNRHKNNLASEATNIPPINLASQVKIDLTESDTTHQAGRSSKCKHLASQKCGETAVKNRFGPSQVPLNLSKRHNDVFAPMPGTPRYNSNTGAIPKHLVKVRPLDILTGVSTETQSRAAVLPSGSATHVPGRYDIPSGSTHRQAVPKLQSQVLAPTLMMSHVEAGPSNVQRKRYLDKPAVPTVQSQVLALTLMMSDVEAGPSNVQRNRYVEKPAVPTVQSQVLVPTPMPDVEAVSPIKQRKRNVDEKLFLKLIEMFPEACPEYIRDLCNNQIWSAEVFDSIVTVIITNENYPRRPERIRSPEKEVDPEEQYEILKELFPDADPTYLRMQCEKYTRDAQGLKQFIDDAMEFKNYPTMKEYLRKQQLSSQQRQYTTEFSVESFVQLFPDPAATFNDNTNHVMDEMSEHYVNLFLRNMYDRIPVKTISDLLQTKKYKVFKCVKVLNEQVSTGRLMKTRRKQILLPENVQNIPLLQKLAYITHRDEIEAFIKEKKIKEKKERQDAKQNGLMETCGCCYDEEVMPTDTFTCINCCKFCRDCIKKSCEIAFGEGKIDFLCLSNCSSEFSLQTLQAVLPPKMFSKIAQKKAVMEVKAAGIEELEMCRFCDFASIPAPDDKIFRCLNPECMKESCRLCNEPSHVPLRCDEVEKDENVEARIYIENKMTEALLRKCWQCNTKFFKEEGCNKMTCSCGAMMCYICGKPVKDYTHFNGIGGDKHHLCPLYSDNVAVNQLNVMNAAAAAKAKVDPNKLKFDPTADIKRHYQERKKKIREPHLELINRQHIYQPLQQLANHLMEANREIRFAAQQLNHNEHVPR